MTFKQDPDDMRSRANRNYSVVPALRKRAEDDPTWEGELYRTGGYGIHAYAMAAREKRKARTRGWTSAADGHEGAGDTGHSGATTFEDTDGDGKRGVDRAVPEV